MTIMKVKSWKIYNQIESIMKKIGAQWVGEPVNKTTLEKIQEGFESVMPEVHRQVKVYEDNKAAGTLKPLPENSTYTNNL